MEEIHFYKLKNIFVRFGQIFPNMQRSFLISLPKKAFLFD